MLTRYMAVAELDPSTRNTYAGYIRRTILPALGAIELRKVRGPLLDTFYARLRRCGDLACTGKPFTEHAVHKWAFASLRRSAWARQFYDTQRARGKSHHAALRALGNRWLEVMWHCLTNHVPYDEATHATNRNRALGLAA